MASEVLFDDPTTNLVRRVRAIHLESGEHCVTILTMNALLGGNVKVTKIFNHSDVNEATFYNIREARLVVAAYDAWQAEFRQAEDV